MSVDVQNTGSVAADEVVAMYVTHTGVAGAPIRALAGSASASRARREKTVSLSCASAN